MTGFSGSLYGLHAFLYGISTSAYLVGVLSEPQAAGSFPANSKIMSFKGVAGHIMLDRGSLFVRKTATAAPSTFSSTHLTHTNLDGDGYFEGKLEVDSTIYGDATGTALEVLGDAKILADNKKLLIGAGSDLELYHDGTNSIIKNNTGQLSVDTTDVVFTTSGSGLVYGGQYLNNPADFAVALTLQNTYYELNGTTAWTASPLNLCTATDPYITVTKAGVYLINWSVAFTTDANAQEIEFGIMLDQTTMVSMGSSHEKGATAGDLLPVSGCALVTLTANQKVSLAAQNVTSAGKTLTIGHANLTIVQVGG